MAKYIIKSLYLLLMKDLLLFLSTSGNSEDLLAFICVAQKLDVSVFSFTGGIGGKLAQQMGMMIRKGAR